MTFSNNNCNQSENMVYLTKIFYNDRENSSPILTALTTTATGFTQQLNISQDNCNTQIRTISNSNCGCGCGTNNNQQVNQTNNRNCACECCCNLEISESTIFEITNSYVIVRSFALSDAAPLTADDVTVEGLPITGLTRSGLQYIGDISGIMPEITRCPCKSPCHQNCPGNFVMITAAGPWTLAATIIVEGTVYENGTACHFRFCFDTVDGTPIDVTGAATFAFCGANIPCQTSGIAPSLTFDFDACVKLLNPEITVTCTNGTCTATLTGSLVVTPQASLQVTRPSLFNIKASEVQVGCDDIGQCNPCNPCHTECFVFEDNCCCDENDCNCKYTNEGCNDIAHQCCETNSYGY